MVLTGIFCTIASNPVSDELGNMPKVMVILRVGLDEAKRILLKQ
jgi:hypothetical protein